MRKHKTLHELHISKDGIGTSKVSQEYDLRACINKLTDQIVNVHLGYNSIVSGAIRRQGLRLRNLECTYDLYKAFYPEDEERVYIHGKVVVEDAPFHVTWRRRK